MSTTQYLQSFKEWQSKFPGPIDHCVALDFKKHDRHICFSVCIHGDEVGSIPGVLKAIQALAENKITFGGKISFTLGNLAAIHKNTRYSEEDLNRVFAKEKSDSYEFSRAQELKKVFSVSHFLVDLHQTIGPTKSPFFLLKGIKQDLQLATALAVTDIAIVEELLLQTLPYETASIFAHKRGALALTIELSEKGYSQTAEDITYKLIKDSCLILDQLQLDSGYIHKLSSQAPPLKLLTAKYQQRFTHAKMSLRPGLLNLQKLAKDEVVGKDENGNPMLAPFEGYILFPKYPKRSEDGLAIGTLPHDIYVMAKEIG